MEAPSKETEMGRNLEEADYKSPLFLGEARGCCLAARVNPEVFEDVSARPDLVRRAFEIRADRF